ncbi:efflux RND transporter permease subunit [Salinibacter ruber]|uniref:efflux RND transporter permease subunit n=1 Tax=Salinibacter ruber TaxID=146919 RepID=UPI00216A0C4B|nr:efflux RND transporter permease subunit [Salinibacter ruber]MCS3698352.1 multidrug efflux pump subunit AcrB [Salinibacter ruber]
MKITNLSINYRTVMVVLTLLITIGGLYSYVSIPKESNPSLDIPYVIVTTPYPGASPDDVENIITQELEKGIQDVNGIEEMRSTSREGISSIVVEFQPSVNSTEAYRKVQDEVTTAQADLPDSVEDPMVNEINTSDFPVLTINLLTDYSLARSKEVAEDLQDELEGIGSVLEAGITGGLEREVQVDVDLAALKGYGLSFNDFVNTIESENTSVPGGDVDVDRQNYLVRIDGRFSEPEVIEDLVLRSVNGKNTYVRDVADVTFGFKERETYSRLQVLKQEMEDGTLKKATGAREEPQQVITLGVEKRSGDNILETIASVKETVQNFDFPSGTQVIYTGDQSEQVETLVTDLQNNIISGLIFVIAVLLFFMGARNATLVGIAIPLSMFTAFLVFQAMGQTLNFVILFSLIIALGMLVDNAVVVVENIYRFREKGYGRFEAARMGAAEVGPAITASTATTIGAFIPLLFWPGIVGQFMSFMPLTLIITLACSLFVALVLNPVITGIFMDVEGQGDENPRDEKQARRIKYASIGGTLLAGLAIGLVNWKTLVVIVVASVAVYFLHTRVMSDLGERFKNDGLPRILEEYREALKKTLVRDYSVRYAMLRNAGALAALSAGALLGLLGGALWAVAGQTAGMIILVPAGLLAGLGVLGILIHTVEGVYLGGTTSVKVGAALSAVMALSIGLLFLSGTTPSVLTMGVLMAGPVAILLIGALGAVFNNRDWLILTDRRSLVLNGTFGLLIVIFGLYAAAPTPVQFFPDTDPGQVQVTVDAPLGTNVEATNKIAQTVVGRLNGLMERAPAVKQNVKNVLVQVGVGGDAAFGGGEPRPRRLQMTINLVDYAKRAEPSTRTIDRIRGTIQNVPGTEIDITKQQQGPQTGPPVNIEITGPEFDQIVQISKEVKNLLAESDIPGLVDVSDDLNAGRPEVRVNVDRQRAGQFGLSTGQIAQTVRSAIAGTKAGEYRDGEDEYDITVRLQKKDRQSIESLNDLTIPYRGGQIPVTAVANLEEGAGFGSITRVDQERVVTVSGDAGPGFTGPEVVNKVKQEVESYRQELPPGYSLSFTGGSEEQEEAFGFLTTALAIGAALILMVLIAEFNSVIAPFIIMTAVALSLIGVVLGLIVTRTPFSLFTFIGIISLAGVVVNNNIVLVDYVMQLRQRGMEKAQAIIEGGATRLRPVLLTALTTMLGLVPLTFGINVDFVGLLTDFAPNFQIGSSNTQFWGPMGTAIIAGLLFGTVLTLVIVPVMYSVFDSLSVRFSQFFGGNVEDASIVSEAVATKGLEENGTSNGAAVDDGLDQQTEVARADESTARDGASNSNPHEENEA